MLHLMPQVHNPNAKDIKYANVNNKYANQNSKYARYQFMLFCRKFTHFSGVQFTGQKMRWPTKNYEETGEQVNHQTSFHCYLVTPEI